MLRKYSARLVRTKAEVLQINLTKSCNQVCSHCYVDAGPFRTEKMDWNTLSACISFLRSSDIGRVEITGGAPELNPNFEELIESIFNMKRSIVVRSNLTVLLEPGKAHLIDFYKRNRVELYCSLPCYTKENVDKQRGEGVFERSIRALRLLNEVGYGKDPSLVLNLVYNPGGAFLPPPEPELEMEYKRVLHEEFGIVFNHIITLTNMPINRFERWLRAEELYERYLSLLYENFNPATLERLMCRYYLNVGWDGRIYDCDFNQMLGLEICDPQTGRPLTIDSVDPQSLEGISIHTGAHCYGCTAGRGSSCRGELVKQ
ncbi:arsenosugar biosynthesis radical SAM protein ArsS [Candidatus Bathyarchaeota archaeon]|nr:arsenosugar biosynthesis radical SAM protein ArsS [Candidatus Bathyarchaeota archaeon]